MKDPKDCSKDEWPDLVQEHINQAKSGNSASIPKILEWLQDVNWPGSDLALQYLSTLGDEILPYVADVLDGNDEVWQYWVLHCMIKQWPTSRTYEIRDKILRLSHTDDLEDVNLAAIEVLIVHRLNDPESLMARLRQIQAYRPDSFSDIDELRNLLRERFEKDEYLP
jgi:hypothetical protein